MRLVGKLWPETRFVVTNKIFKLILQVLERLFFTKGHWRFSPLCMRLQVRQLLRVVFLCYLVALPLPVFSYTLLLSSVSTIIFPTVYAWYQLKNYTTPKPASITQLRNKNFFRQLLGIP